MTSELSELLTFLTEPELAEISKLTPKLNQQARTIKQLQDDPANLFALTGKTPDPWQAELLRSESKRMLLLCNRQAGKSTTAAALALREALVHPPALVLLLSPSLRQSAELFRKVADNFSALNRPAEVSHESVLRIEFANGSRILSLPADEKNIRGFSGAAMLVIDEAARVEDALYYAVRPMLAVSGGKLVALSTPFGKRGWFYNEWHSENAWERVRVTADMCPRIPAAFLEEERRTLGAEWYAQEYECDFTAGSGSPLFPSAWLDRAGSIAASLGSKPRHAKAIGIDPAEGGDKTAMAAVDEYGLIELVSKKTPDTSIITSEALAFMRKHGVPPERVVFDRGGGGKEHADRLRSQGCNVRTVAFGESLAPDPKHGLTPVHDRVEHREERYAYMNRRAEMYGELRQLLDPMGGLDGKGGPNGWGLPAEYRELREQLAPIPLQFDPEGRLKLPPKNKRNPESKEVSLVELIGHSPDEADALVLGVHGMLHKGRRATARAF